jgi:hypothetical protein
MKVTQASSLALCSIAAQGKSFIGSTPQNRPAKRKAVMGGTITALAVATHVRSSVAAQGKSPLGNTSQNRQAERKAVMGGTITAPAVAAHVRRGISVNI